MPDDDVPEMYRGSQKQIDGYRYVAALSRRIDDPDYRPLEERTIAYAPRPQPKSGTIYFVGPEGGPIKIGFATRLEFRLKDLRTMNPYPLVVHARVEGPPSLERAYHEQFAEHRLHGEWFAPHPDVLAEIERLNEEVPSQGRAGL